MPRAAARRAAHSSTFCRSPPTTSCPSHLASGPLFLTHKRTNLLLCVDRSPCAAAGYAGYFSTTARIKDKRTPLEAALANVGRCGNDAMHTAASRDCWLGNANDGAHAAPGTACLFAAWCWCSCAAFTQCVAFREVPSLHIPACCCACAVTLQPCRPRPILCQPGDPGAAGEGDQELGGAAGRGEVQAAEAQVCTRKRVCPRASTTR